MSPLQAKWQNPITAYYSFINLKRTKGCRVPTGQGKLEKVREFEWSGKVRENAKVTGKSGKCWENFSHLVQLL